MLALVDGTRIGRVVRHLRRRLGWRQVDLAAEARVSQSVVSRIERGRLELVGLPALQRVLAALDARLILDISWRGGLLDRVLDERHAALVERVTALLRASGWEVQVEVSFSHFGERGSFDVLAWHAATRSLVAIEVKSELTSIEATLRAFDVKRRLASTVARERFGWDPASVSCLLVLPDDSTVRRRITQHAGTFASAFPTPGSRVRGWLRRPTESINAVWLSSPSHGVTGKRPARTPHRVRLAKSLPPGRQATTRRESAASGPSRPA
jgi:transcriptional regulator with XRE-family HTH domain